MGGENCYWLAWGEKASWSPSLQGRLPNSTLLCAGLGGDLEFLTQPLPEYHRLQSSTWGTRLASLPSHAKVQPLCPPLLLPPSRHSGLEGSAHPEAPLSLYPDLVNLTFLVYLDSDFSHLSCSATFFPASASLTGCSRTASSLPGFPVSPAPFHLSSPCREVLVTPVRAGLSFAESHCS